MAALLSYPRWWSSVRMRKERIPVTGSMRGKWFSAMMAWGLSPLFCRCRGIREVQKKRRRWWALCTFLLLIFFLLMSPHHLIWFCSNQWFSLIIFVLCSFPLFLIIGRSDHGSSSVTSLSFLWIKIFRINLWHHTLIHPIASWSHSLLVDAILFWLSWTPQKSSSDLRLVLSMICFLPLSLHIVFVTATTDRLLLISLFLSVHQMQLTDTKYFHSLQQNLPPHLGFLISVRRMSVEENDDDVDEIFMKRGMKSSLVILRSKERRWNDVYFKAKSRSRGWWSSNAYYPSLLYIFMGMFHRSISPPVYHGIQKASFFLLKMIILNWLKFRNVFCFIISDPSDQMIRFILYQMDVVKKSEEESGVEKKGVILMDVVIACFNFSSLSFAPDVLWLSLIFSYQLRKGKYFLVTPHHFSLFIFG